MQVCRPPRAPKPRPTATRAATSQHRTPVQERPLHRSCPWSPRGADPQPSGDATVASHGGQWGPFRVVHITQPLWVDTVRLDVVVGPSAHARRYAKLSQARSHLARALEPGYRDASRAHQIIASSRDFGRRSGVRALPRNRACAVKATSAPGSPWWVRCGAPIGHAGWPRVPRRRIRDSRAGGAPSLSQ
jgi:hypothetical protein